MHVRRVPRAALVLSWERVFKVSTGSGQPASPSWVVAWALSTVGRKTEGLSVDGGPGASNPGGLRDGCRDDSEAPLEVFNVKDKKPWLQSKVYKQ